MSKPVIIRDLPLSQGQLHLHGDRTGTSLYGGRLYDYSRNEHRTLNAYEAAMADYYASNLDLKKIR